MADKALECGDCGAPAHYHDGKFMGCCTAGHCENEGHASVRAWNQYTIRRLRGKAKHSRSVGLGMIEAADAIEARIVAIEVGGNYAGV